MHTTTIGRAARALGVHPRTIVRAVRRDECAPFIQAYDPPLPIAPLARAVRCEATIIRRALAGRDRLLSEEEAAGIAGIKHRTFRYRVARHRDWRPDARVGNRVARWSENRIAVLAERWEFNRPNGGRP